MEFLGIVLTVNTALNAAWFFIITDIRDRLKRIEDLHIKK
jgi:hypothetical protein